jgi:molybdenum cofactor cytidylyltransferase
LKERISLVVLAAGKSTRTKDNKLLLKLDGETMVEHVVKTCLASDANEVAVVLGYEAEKIRESLAHLKCKFVMNERYEVGQSESVKSGLSAISSDAEGMMVLPADVALIDRESINRIMDEYKRTGSRIVIASHQRQSGHPIVLDKSLFPEIKAIDEQTLGLKAVINRHRAEVRYVEAPNESVLIDIDTQEEFDKHFRKS